MRAAVMQATRDELVENGYEGLNVSAVADRAGVHRSTVHRRWPERGALVAEALLDEVGPQIPIPDQGDLQSDLRLLLQLIVARLNDPFSAAIIRALLTGREHSQEVAEVARQVWTTRFAQGEAMFERARERGELREDVSSADLMRMAVGPLYVRFLVTGEPLGEDVIDSTVDLLISGSKGP